MRNQRLILLIGAVVVLAAWPAIYAVDFWRYRTELRQAERAFVAQRFGEARERLARMSVHWPGRGMIEYWLGAAENREGHAEAALEAWERVPAGAPEAAVAALSIGRVAGTIGRYRLAESSLERVVRLGGEMGEEARQLLSHVHFMTGRRDDYRNFLHREIERTRDPSEKLRTMWSVDRDPYPVDAFTLVLEKANQTTPDDDRVWLGLADLAMRTGRFDLAGDWLTRCESARPDDLAVRLARLEWAKAADRPGLVIRAASHLPISSVTESRVLELEAWLAERGGDRAAERQALLAYLAVEPADVVAIERLADLAAQDGDRERLASLRSRKAAIENARDHYKQMINQPELAPQAAEFARAGETIGRRFDARAWWRIAAQRDPTIEREAAAAQARLARAEPRPASGLGTLADLLEPFRARALVKKAAPTPSQFYLPAFVDDAERRGIAFHFKNGLTDLHQIPETMSGGVALIDFDGDGWLDVYALQGGTFPPPADRAEFGDRLFRNTGDGRFVDVTASAGLAKLPGGYSHGVAVGDYDNDGRPDLFVTRWRSYALYHNIGGGRFEDATAQAGFFGDRDWPTSAAWADLDNDGDLDLYVCHYLKWETTNPALCGYPGNPAAGYTYCDPRGFPALPDHVFRNDGGRFVDMTSQTGLVDHDGRGLGVVAADFDDDGRIDLFVANDTTANYFLRNQGGFRFTEEGLESGLAASSAGGYLAGMGVACGDFDGDGRLDLAVTNFYNQSTTLYHNHGNGVFSDRAADSGLGTLTRLVLGFGLAALDANNDGWLDLSQANGHVGDYRPSIPYPMRAQLFLGESGGKFVDVSDKAGPAWQVLRLGRGLAVGDIDNDGRTDVLIVSQNAPLALLHNESIAPTHSILLMLEGTKSNRDAVGARVAVTAGGKTQVATRFGGGSYLSASDPRLSFGLGSATTADRVEITWPSGRVESYQQLAADACYRLREGNPAAVRLFPFGKPKVNK
jgi:enediyne biosynthesis protein E4